MNMVRNDYTYIQTVVATKYLTLQITNGDLSQAIAIYDRIFDQPI